MWNLIWKHSLTAYCKIYFESSNKIIKRNKTLDNKTMLLIKSMSLSGYNTHSIICKEGVKCTLKTRSMMLNSMLKDKASDQREHRNSIEGYQVPQYSCSSCC